MSAPQGQPSNVPGLEGELRAEPVRVRVGMIGCGSHTFRNVLPVLRFLPQLELVACCDRNLPKAEAYARTFGAPHAFGDYREMIRALDVDAALLVLGFDADGRPSYPPVAAQLLSSGVSVWMEKPPAATAVGVRQILDACTDRTIAQVGFKKIFSPGVQRIAELLDIPEFGTIQSYHYRYTVDLPAVPGALMQADARRFLDDFVHVASVLVHLLGLPSRLTAYRSGGGDGVLVLEHATGTTGTVWLSRNASDLDAVEELTVVGEGAHARLSNGVNVEYFPRGWRGPYGRSTDFLPHGDVTPTFGPVRWTPEHSLGTLAGGTHFLQGYFHQLRAFVHAVLDMRREHPGDLHDALDVMTLVDAIRAPHGERRAVGQGSGRRRRLDEGRYGGDATTSRTPRCSRTGQPFAMKDGWNYVCATCGATATQKEAEERPCAVTGD